MFVIYSSNRRQLKLFLAIAFCCLLYLAFLYSKEERYLEPSITIGYWVDTEACRISKWPLFDEETSRIYRDMSKKEYRCQRTMIDIKRVNATAVSIDSRGSSVTCYAQEVTRNNRDDSYSLGRRVDSISGVTNFPTFDSVYIFCTDIKSQRKENRVLPLVPIKTKIQPKVKATQPKKPNVLMLGIDSVSWLQFRRHFKQSQPFMESHGFVPIYGFNKIGLNTFPNLVGVLTGHHSHTYYNGSDPDMHFDHLPLIWKSYSEQGYMTSLIEDMPGFSVFNYEKKGFVNQPTDYYLRPSSLIVNRNENHEFCYKDKLTTYFYYTWILEHVKAMHARNQTYFTFSHMADLTHDEHLMAGHADKPLHWLLREIFNYSLQENTIIFVYSDHGIRFGPLRTAKSGYGEERIPFLYVYIPDNFFIKPDAAREILRHNSQRLTCHFDLHATLRHIVEGKPPSDEPYGVSLLTKVSSSRTCAKAGIGPKWCMCLDRMPVQINQTTADSLAHFVVTTVNQLIDKHRSICRQWSLTKIVNVAGQAHSSHAKQSEPTYLIQVRLSPGEALFEASIGVKTNASLKGSVQFETQGPITRLDRYAPHSKCIHDAYLERYCYCKNS